mgnify:CR=1 FL=1
MKKKTTLTKMHIAPSTVRYDAVAARDSNEVGQILAGTRKRNGYSLVAFSELLRHYGVDVSDKGISKWEKGLSVPDADTLSKLADVLEIKVSELLGSEIKEETNKNEVAEQLAKISEQLALKNRRHKRIWKVIGFILLAVIVINMLLVVLGTVTYNEKNADITTIEEKLR